MSKVHLRRLKGGRQVDFTYLNKDGRMVRFRRLIKGSRKEVEAKGRELKRQADAKGYVPGYDDVAEERTDRLPMHKVLNLYFDQDVKIHNSASEINNKESMLRNHIGPFFGDRDIRDLRTADCLTFQAQLCRKPRSRKKGDRGKNLSKSRVNKIMGCFRKFCNWAVEMGIIEVSPMKSIKPLPVPEFEPKTWNEEECLRFLKMCKEHRPDWLCFFTTAALTGMRAGELCALKWLDIDFENSAIRIQRSVWRGIEKCPKGRRNRSIPLNNALSEMLINRREKAVKSEYVFANDEGRQLAYYSYRKPFDHICNRAGVTRIRFHDIRHSFASQLVMNGKSLEVVKKLLGHSDIRVTMRYTHSPNEAMKDAVNSLLPGLERQETCQRICQRTVKKRHLTLVK